MRKLLYILIAISLFHNFTFGQWIQQNSGTTGNLNSVYFVNWLTGWVCGVTGQASTDRIAKTTDGGITWVRQNAGTFRILNSIHFINDQTGWAAGIHGTVVKTTNGGTNWIQYLEIGTIDLYSIQFINENTGWISGTNDIVYKSTDGGINWQPYPAFIGLIRINFADINTGYLIAGAFDGKISKTTNGGINWLQSSINSQTFTSIYFINKYTGWLAGSEINSSNSITMNTTNGGINWNTAILGTFLALREVYFIDSVNGWLTSYSGKIYKTSNSGLNWANQVTNISTELKDIYFVDNQFGWAVGVNGTFLRTTNGGEPVGINVISNNIPNEFNLFQNYPNPFNPSTKIKFNIAKSSLVKIYVYDIIGKEISVLVNEEIAPGTFEVEWNGIGLPSGIYFYKLKANNFTETKKMILIK